MELRWSELAADDLERICTWIERDNPAAAQRIAMTIYAGCERLINFPHAGRESTRAKGWRELSFPPLPYIAVYRVKRDAVEIARIWHGAQNWP